MYELLAQEISMRTNVPLSITESFVLMIKAYEEIVLEHREEERIAHERWLSDREQRYTRDRDKE